VEFDLVTEPHTLANYLLFPVTPVSGLALAVYLEPESKYGLYRRGALEFLGEPDSAYPVFRISYADLSQLGDGMTADGIK
jgi:hypothetical protein